MLKVVEKRGERKAGEELWLPDEIARAGARRMLSEALRAEADDYVERHRCGSARPAERAPAPMAFKLLHMARQRWRRLDGAHLLPPVPTGVKLVDGVRDGPAQPITQPTDHLTGKTA